MSNKISFVGVSSSSVFENNEIVKIDIFIDENRILIETLDEENEKKNHEIFKVEHCLPNVMYHPLEKSLFIDEFIVWKDDLGRVNKKSVMHQFHDVSPICQ